MTNPFHDTHNKAVEGCILLARYQAKLTKDNLAALALEGTTVESREFIVRSVAEIKALNALCESYERLKI